MKSEKEVNSLKLKGFRVKKLATTKQEPSTQKATGVWKLIKQNPMKTLNPVPAFLVVNSDDETQGRDDWPFKDSKEKVFARPCPESPQHGFVDSRLVKDKKDAQGLFEEVLDVDPKAELLLMKYIDGPCSAIWVAESGSLTIGKGTDGATSGKNAVQLMTTPVAVDEEFRKAARIAKDDHTYFEIVYSDRPYVVQARSGPPIPGGVTEFIPKKLKVEQVLTPSDDLLAHQELCKALAGSEGVVFWQPNGSLASHPAVHCALNNIPYLTREERPKVGDWIEPTELKPMFNAKEFHIGLRYTEQSTSGKQDVAEHLNTAIAIVHNITTLQYSPAYSRLLGYSVGWIFRAAAMACLGESRHYRGNTHGKKGALGTTDRSAVYERAGGMTNAELCRRLATFSYKFVHNTWSSGYGGWKWFSALVKAIKLWNYLSYGRYMEAAAEANILLNMAHNGGWLFNKFTDQSFMNRAAEFPAEVLCARAKDLWNVFLFEGEILPVMPRTYRASARWKLALDAAPGAKIDKKTWKPGLKNTPVILRINAITWHQIHLNQETMQVLEEALEHV